MNITSPEKKQFNYGFVSPTIQPTDYIFGSAQLDSPVLVDNGQWPESLVPDEQQNLFDTETWNCTGFATSTPYEMIIAMQYKEQMNFCDRGLGIMAGTKPPGNSPNVVAHTAHKMGMFDESFLPFVKELESADGYFKPNPLPDNLIQEALKLLQEYELGYQWTFSQSTPLQEKQERMIEALRHSVLGIAIQAWQQNDNGLYTQTGSPNHWTNVLGYKKGEYWICKDSYPPFIKHIEWNTDFQFCMQYAVKKLSPPAPVYPIAVPSIPVKVSFWDKIKQSLCAH